MGKIYLAEKSQLDGIGGSFCTCSTAAATAAKTASLSNFTMKTGAQVAVKFTYANTASSPTLNINGTGAKSIYYHNSAVPAAMLMAGGVYLMVYDGSRWQLMGNHFAEGINGELGALQFYNALRSSYYSGSSLTFASTASPPTFTTSSVSDGGTVTSTYGKINIGDFVKQGYKKLLLSVQSGHDTSNSSMTPYMTTNCYISTSSSTSNAVVSASCQNYTDHGYAKSKKIENQDILLDISGLTSSYYFIFTNKNVGYAASVTVSNIFLLS